MNFEQIVVILHPFHTEFFLRGLGFTRITKSPRAIDCFRSVVAVVISKFPFDPAASYFTNQSQLFSIFTLTAFRYYILIKCDGIYKR